MKRYFTIYEEVKEQYYKIPKAFMLEESKYFKMSPMAKLIYSILSDRNSISIKNKWVDKTRQDFRRQDHYDAWIDHNRAKEYTKYIKARDKERKKIIGEIKEVPDTHYVGNPGVYHTEYIKFKY